MKTVTFVLAISLFSTKTLGQNQEMPDFYLDGEKINIEKVHINPQMIDSIKIQKNVDGGNVIISSKSKLNFYTLNDIIKEFSEFNNQEMKFLFKIDTTFTIDTTGVLIDKSFFIYVNSFNISKASYINNKCNDLTIIEITLLDKEREPQIRIRGEDLLKKIEN